MLILENPNIAKIKLCVSSKKYKSITKNFVCVCVCVCICVSYFLKKI